MRKASYLKPFSDSSFVGEKLPLSLKLHYFKRVVSNSDVYYQQLSISASYQVSLFFLWSLILLKNYQRFIQKKNDLIVSS